MWHPFVNPARDDKATFSHWTKKKEAGDAYAFARFNRKATVVTYTEEQYDKVVAPLKSDWTKLETDVLFDLCERFNLRFIIIADRFSYELQERLDMASQEELKASENFGEGKKKRQVKRDRKMMVKPSVKDRSVDEVKQRYYQVAKAILTLQGATTHPIVLKPFNFEQEVRRKNNLEKLFMRTKDQMEREKLMQIELKKIEQKIKKEEKEERNLAKLIDNDFEEAKYQFSLEKSSKSGKKDGHRLYQGVMLLSNRLLTKLPVSEPIQMQMEAALQGMKIDPSSLHCSRAVCEEFDNLREQLLIYFAIDKFINKKKEE